MKPRIYIHLGVWHCMSPQKQCGMGYTPAQAYADWDRP